MGDNHLGRRPRAACGEISELRSLLHFLSLGRPVSQGPESSLWLPITACTATCLSRTQTATVTRPLPWAQSATPGPLSLHKRRL